MNSANQIDGLPSAEQIVAVVTEVDAVEQQVEPAETIQNEIQRKLTPILLARHIRITLLRDIRAQGASTPVSSLASSPQPSTGAFEDIPLDATLHPDDPRLHFAVSTPSSNGSAVSIGSYDVVSVTQSPPPAPPWPQAVAYKVNEVTEYVRSFKFPGF